MRERAKQRSRCKCNLAVIKRRERREKQIYFAESSKTDQAMCCFILFLTALYLLLGAVRK